jgi:uncharacterized protein (TIGR00645 family)
MVSVMRASNEFNRSAIILETFGEIIFATRWMLIPLYVGLYAALAIYVYKFFEEVAQMLWHFRSLTEGQMVLGIISLVDIIMVANLVVMISISGFSVFVREYKMDELSNRPRWMNRISSSSQKIKMGMSLIGIMMVHILHNGMEAKEVGWEELGKQIAVSVLFMFLTLGLCYVDKMLHANEHMEHSY